MNDRVKDLFHDLADLTPDARARYFAEHPVDDPTRHEVEELLAFDEGASAFLVRGVSIAASRSLPQLDPQGWRCGPYRLLDLIGRGGMGAVYLAERADGEVTQRLAVKLLPFGAGDPQRERFLQERQILASLAHPNIARMLDAGHIENGQPFLAMEYIDGQPIDVFAAGLSVRQIVTLFRKVCAAVAYLHRNLVVHRDLKPGNILVTGPASGHPGEPKILDFGIAKMLDIATDATMTSMRMLTPDYASPEQATGGRLSTATDIYSLGAVLYRLLTGRPPHELQDGSPEAIAQVLASREVTRPSRRVPELKGDLDSILLKALRKDPQERYATVEQFAEDLEAFLGSRTVRARSGNAWYRARKWVRRYWAPVAAASLVIASLSAGLYVADRQRRVAERRFAQLHDLSKKVLDLPAELKISDLGITGRVATLSMQYLEGLGREAAHDKVLALEIATGYLKVARVQGVPEWNQLGHYAEAQESLRRAEEFAGLALRAEPANRQALWLWANLAHDRAVTAYAQRHPADVLANSPKAVESFDRLARLGNLTRREINGATYIYGDLAEVHIALHRFADAARYARLAIEYSRNTQTVPGPRAQAFNMLASAMMDLGDFPAAQEAMKHAREELESLPVRDPTPFPEYMASTRYQTRLREGLMLAEDGGVNFGRPSEAVPLLEQAFAAMGPYAQTRSDYLARTVLATAGRYLGDVVRHTDAHRALDVYDYSLKMIREVPEDVTARRLEAVLLAGSSYPLRRLHRAHDSQERIDAAFRILRDTQDYPAEVVPPDSEAAVTLRALADHSSETGKPQAAIALYQELLRKMTASNPDPRNDLPNATRLSDAQASLAAILRRVGRNPEAAAIQKQRLETWQSWDHKLPNNPFVRRQLASSR